jgi:DNA-binding MarR family transcriptional regulator
MLSVVTAEELTDALAVVRRALRRASRRPQELTSLTGAQLELVRLLRRSPGTSVAEAARELRVAPNTVSTLVSRLLETGVIVKRPDPGDRRVARLDLSPRARRSVEAWRDRRLELLDDALARLPRVDARRLAAARPALERLAELLEAGE